MITELLFPLNTHAKTARERQEQDPETKEAPRFIRLRVSLCIQDSFATDRFCRTGTRGLRRKFAADSRRKTRCATIAREREKRKINDETSSTHGCSRRRESPCSRRARGWRRAAARWCSSFFRAKESAKVPRSKGAKRREISRARSDPVRLHRASPRGRSKRGPLCRSAAVPPPPRGSPGARQRVLD